MKFQKKITVIINGDLRHFHEVWRMKLKLSLKPNERKLTDIQA